MLRKPEYPKIVRGIISFMIIMLFGAIQSIYAQDWKALYDSASHSYDIEDYNKALEWGLQAKISAERDHGKNSKEYEKVLYKLVDYYFYCDKADSALVIAREDSSVIFNVYGRTSPEYCGNINNLGLIYYVFGNYALSEISFIEAKKIHEEMPVRNDSAYSFTMNNLALIYEILGKFTLAEPLYNESISLITDTSGIAYAETVHNLAALYRRMGKYKKSDTLFKKSLELNKRLKGDKHPDIAFEYNNIADLYKLMGRYNEAEPLYKEAVRLIKEIYGKENPEYAKTVSNLALLYFAMGRYDQAEPLFKEAMDIQRIKKGEDHPEYAATTNNLALLYETIGEFQKADTLYQIVLISYKKKFGEEHPFFATTLDNLAKLYRKMGFYEKSEEMFIKTKEIRKNTLGIEHPNYASTLFNLANLYEIMNKYNESEPLFLQALKLRKESLGDDHPDFARSLSGLAILYQKMHRFSDAEPYFLEAIGKYLAQVKRYFPYLSEKEKLQFWTSVKGSFEDFDAFSSAYYELRPDILTNMYNNCLTTKGLILSSTKKVLRKIRESKDTSVTNILTKWLSTKDYWLWLVQNSDKAKEQGVNIDSIADLANELEKSLSSKSEDFKKAFETKDITWQDVRKALKPGEAAIEIIRFRQNSQKVKENDPDTVFYAALIIKNDTKDHPEIAILRNGNELESDYIKLYGNLVKILKIQPIKKRTGLEAELMEKDQEDLYMQFWLKVQNKLIGIKKIYLSVDGVYNSINLMTLKNPTTKKYLLDELDLRIVTNTKDIIEYASMKGLKVPNTAELFGDPTYNLHPNEEKLIPPLAGTKIEVENIAKEMIIRKWKVKEFSEERALEEKVKEVKSPKVLHIATHGVFLQDVDASGDQPNMLGADASQFVENPLLRSMLIFAGAENKDDSGDEDTDDGKLTAYEAMDLNLDNTDIVVLSACETGLGEVKNGEGVYGLQRAFQVAGARSLIMSLWTVSDEATQKLMTSFYDKMLNGIDKRKAFRQTQLELKEIYPEFYYWGAFVMVGE